MSAKTSVSRLVSSDSAGEHRSEATGMSGDAGYIELEKGGLLTTIQDLGRPGKQVYGVPLSGAMDRFSMQVANLLVGNPPDAPVLEFTLIGPVIRFSCAQVIAITGGDFHAHLDGVPVPAWQAVPVEAGARLVMGPCSSGARGYLAVAGGFPVPPVMGSAATNLRGGYGGWHGRALKTGDRIPVPDLGARSRPFSGMRRRLAPRWIPDYAAFRPVRVIRGPHADHFHSEAWQRFLASNYRVSPASDRMGYRLQGPALTHQQTADILPTFIFPGTIQVPADGQPIVLMADCQVTGGYAVIGVVAGVDLPYVAQRKPGDELCFRAISVEEAQQLRRQEAVLFASLQAACLGHRSSP